MKIVAIVVLSICVIALGIQVYSFVAQEWHLGSELADVQTNFVKAQTEETSLQQENQYLSNPENLEKELRARFNYKKPGETMIIIESATTSTTSTD